MQTQNQLIHRQKLRLLLVPTPLHCCAICGTANSSVQTKRRVAYPGKWGVELIMKELLSLELKTSSDPILPLVWSHTHAGNHPRCSVWTSESAAGAASWALHCVGTVVGESEMSVGPGGCMVAPEWGSLAGSNQLHAEPTRGMTAHVD